MGFGWRKTWESNSPETLVDTVTRYCLKNLELLTYNKDGVQFLKDDILLPAEICEKFISIAKEEDLQMTDQLLNIFQPNQTKLISVSLENSQLTDEGARTLLSHGLRDLEMKRLKNLTVNTLHTLNKYSSRLQRLEIGSEVSILPDYLQPQGTFSDSESEDERDGNIFERQGYIIQAPNLRSLCIRDLYVLKGSNYFHLLLKPLPGLTRLDLSGSNHKFGFTSFDWLLHCKSLVKLTLHNVPNLESSLNELCQLVNLEHLDISQCKESRAQLKDSEVFLSRLVESLPLLSSLDISGTNLTSPSANSTNASLCLTSVLGLTSRVNNPLEFLGLYKTVHTASYWNRDHIPARLITGDRTEEQILLAGRLYIDRPSVLENILNDLFAIFRSESSQNLRLALEVLLNAMDRHTNEKHIQISGSASLYYIVKSEYIQADLNLKVKRKILSVLFNGMITHKSDDTMMRNGCLTLCHFKMPQDVLFDYCRLVQILLHIISAKNNEESHFIKRVAMFLLNSLACQVEGEQRELVGRLGAIEKLLNIIKEKLRLGNCDDVMETAWSAMWNVTDETPSNCERFLNGNGMNLFLKCKEQFPDHTDLLRNMLGLLGNVAEVPHLRSKLMTSEIVDEFSFLLDSNTDGIEVSYNAAGVLAHMASDGLDAWTIDVPERDFVLRRMVRAINRWQIDSKRNINYRSFEPIIQLLFASHTAECQLWAVWAIANLTKVTPQKYCPLVLEEGGMVAIEKILNHTITFDTPTQVDVVKFATLIRENVDQWQANKDRLEYHG